MPFERKPIGNDEDPELVAEREFESLSSGSGGSGKKSVASSNGSAAPRNASVPAAKDPVEVASIGSGKNSSVNFKETKASRKKRCRGVSGSSIKKDGGRFDLGMEDYDQYDDVSDNEMDDIKSYVANKYGNELPGSESDEFSNDGPREDSPLPAEGIRLRKAIIEAIKDPVADEALHFMTEVLLDFFDEKVRVEMIEKVLDDMVMKDEWTLSRAIDRMCEYKTVILLSKMIQQGLISLSAFEDHLKRNPVDSQTLRLMKSAVGFFKDNAPEMSGDVFKEPPVEFSDLCSDLARSGEISCVRDALKGCPFFHADLIYQVCNNVVTGMNIDTICAASKSFKDLIAEKLVTVAAVNAGVSRFLTELRDTEVDLPAASSLAYLLISYCSESPACIDYTVYRKCPRPRKFLRKRTASSGRLSIREDCDEECNETNYLSLN